MPLTIHSRLGPYEILAPLGAGGMGEVYRARDTRLGRDVAIKVVPEHLSREPEIRARFEREARTVSSLNHPHICALYDVGREGDTDYLVMELVEGDTLADRLKRGALPPTEVLRLGAQIADALDRAHRAGVVHRDLKPGNVMLTRGGAKLMDFGLARATGMMGPAGSGASMLTQSPTIAQPLTAEGSLVGTFQYMAPEQLEGGEADARSDIWALGCVLYEMATGRRAFEGRSQASLIAAILEREPPPVSEAPSGSGSLGGALPHGFDRLVRNCLAKEPDERIQTAHDVKLQLQSLAETLGVPMMSGVTPPGAVVVRRGGARLPWAIAAAGVLVTVAAVAWLLPRTQVRPAPVRFQVASLPGMTDVLWPRISPDGRVLLLTGQDSSGTNHAFLRPLDQVQATPVPGTEGANRCYWSPDGREIAFVVSGRVCRLPASGGTPTVVCQSGFGSDLSWGSGGTILVDGSNTDSLRAVPAGGGDMRPATRIDRAAHETGSAWPSFLPDGRHFLYIGITGSSGNIHLGQLGSFDAKVLGTSDGRAEYAPGGWVLFVRGNILMAQKLDLGAGKLTGPPIPIVENLRVGTSAGHFSVSANGVLACGVDPGSQVQTIRVADAHGALAGAPVASGLVINPKLSPDGGHLMYQRLPGSGTGDLGEVHVVDLARGSDTPLTFAGDKAASPQWSPDGRRVAFVARGDTTGRILIGSADGIGAPTALDSTGSAAYALSDWASAGSQLLYISPSFEGYIANADGTGHARRVLDSHEFMVQDRLSPDGRFVAGAMGTVPNFSIYVQSMTGPAGRWQVSTAPAINPVWTRDGHHIIYEGWDGRLMEVDVDTRQGFQVTTPRVLFTLPKRSSDVDVRPWDCDATGSRFYVVVPLKAQSGSVVDVTTSFQSLVSRR